MDKGFTLVETLVALTISGVLMAGVFTAFQTQQKSYVVQEQVAEIQANLRFGLEIMTRDLRMSGFGSGATIYDAEIDAISFSYDQGNDGTLDYFAYDLYDSTAADSVVIGRGASTGAAIPLTESPVGSGHFVAGTHQPFALNIEALEFNYQLADGTWNTSPSSPADIRTVQVSILAKAAHPDNQYRGKNTYLSAAGTTWGPYDDGYRRRLQIMTVSCRNMGL